MSDQASQGSVSGSGYDGAFADSLLHNCDEEAASLQHVLGSTVQASGWTLGANLGQMQPGGADYPLLHKGAVNAGLLSQHGGVSQFSETSLQEPSAYVRQPMASLLQPGPCDPGYFPALFSTGSPDVQWTNTSSNHASQGLGPVKQLSFGPTSIQTNAPLETTPQSWPHLEKHPGTSYKTDLLATPLSQIQSRTPSLECGWSPHDGSFSQAQRYTPGRQHLVAPKTGVATSPENRSPVWQHEGSRVQTGASPDMWKEPTRSGPQAPFQKDSPAAGRQPQHARQSPSSAPQGRHYMSAAALSFQGHPPQVPLQPLRDQAEHLLRNRLVHHSAHRFEGGRIGRRWEKQENREKKLHAQSSGQLPLSSPASLAPDPSSLHPRQQAPPRPPGLRLNALCQDTSPAIPKLHHANPAAKQAHAAELRYSSPEASGYGSQRQGPPVHLSSQRSDCRYPRAQTGVPGGDALRQAGISSLQNQQGAGHSAHRQRAEDSLWGRQQAPVVTLGTKGVQGRARNLGDRSHDYGGGLHSQRLVSGQDMDVGPHWHAGAGSPDRGAKPDPAHVAGSMHSRMQPSTYPAPGLHLPPQERGQKDSFGPDTPATRALQSQLSSTQLAKAGVWRSADPAGAALEDLHTLSGQDQRSPVQTPGPLDTAEASAEHVPSRATRQRGRAPRKAVRRTTQGGTPEKVDVVGGHAAVVESSFPVGTGAPQGWLGYCDGTGLLGPESHHEFPEDEWEEKPLGEQGVGETAEAVGYEAVDQYPLGRFSRASAKFDQALGFENVDEFGNEVSEGKKRPREEAESETERAAYLSSVEALSGINTAARSRIACELEKQAIILALEEGHVVKRIKLMGILSGSAPDRATPEPAAATPSLAVCPNAGPGPTRGDADVESKTGEPFLDGLPVAGTEMPGLQPFAAAEIGALRTGPDTVEGGDGSEGHVGGPHNQPTAAVPTAGPPFFATAPQNATPFVRPSSHFAVPSDPGQPTAHLFADVQDAMSDSEDKENIRPTEDAAASEDMEFETDLDSSPPQEEQSGNASPVLLTPAIGEGVSHSQSVGNVVLFPGARAAGGFAEAMVRQEPVRCALGSSEETGEDDPLLALQPAAKRHKADHGPPPVAPSTPAETAANAASVFGASPAGEAREKRGSPPFRSKVARSLVSHPLTPPKSSFPSLPSPANQPLPIATRWSSVSSRTPSPPGGKAGGVPSPKSSPDRMRPALCSAPYNLGSPTKSREGRGPFSSPQKTSPGKRTIPSPAKSRNSTASPPKKGSKGSGPSSSSSRSMGPSPPKSSPAKMARWI